MATGEGIIVFLLWYIAIAINYYRDNSTKTEDEEPYPAICWVKEATSLIENITKEASLNEHIDSEPMLDTKLPEPEATTPKTNSEPEVTDVTKDTQIDNDA